MNIFNDPEDFKAADAVMAELEKLPSGSITTIESLFKKAAPTWDASDIALSDADREIRKQAQKKGIALVTMPEYREWADERSYKIPFKVINTKQNKQA